MKTFLLMFAVMVGLPLVVLGSPEDELKALEQQWIDAYIKSDVGFLRMIEADEYALTDFNGSVVTKAQDIKSVVDKSFVCKSASMRDMKVRSMGDDYAYVTAIVTLNATDEGKDISGDYEGVDIFKKKDGKWQAIFSQLTKMKKDK